MPIIFLLVVFVISMIACHQMAKNKGETNPVAWGVAGLLFGPLAVIYLLIFK